MKNILAPAKPALIFLTTGQYHKPGSGIRAILPGKALVPLGPSTSVSDTVVKAIEESTVQNSRLLRSRHGVCRSCRPELVKN